ncbi:MAG: hypothetical protein NTW91_11040 [Verrucomicrobia bacterium]|nr:hypothetical protein [Verrucomicrobiota bacterium]
MNSRSSKNRNALEILLLAVVLLAGYALFQKLTGSSAVLLESNLQSNLARISRYLHAPKIDTVLVGSSVAGRLLPEYFRTRGMEVSNLGLDGCRTLHGLEIVQQRKDLPTLVLVDTSALFMEANANEATLRDAVSSPTFHMGEGFTPFRPENRPLSLLYWWMKKLSDRRGGAKTHSAWIADKPKNELFVKEGEAAEDDTNDRAIKNALFGLKSKGVDVRLVEIPRAEGWGHPRGGKLREISEKTGVPILEPGVEIAKTTETLHFTDGLHLDVPSAKAVSAKICEELGDPK